MFRPCFLLVRADAFVKLVLATSTSATQIVSLQMSSDLVPPFKSRDKAEDCVDKISRRYLIKFKNVRSNRRTSGTRCMGAGRFSRAVPREAALAAAKRQDATWLCVGLWLS